MKPRKLIAPLTIFFIFLSGFFLQTINFLEVKTDAVSSATKSDYESGGYDRFLQKFQLPPAANNYEILSLYEKKKAVYTVLVNTEKEGGASASEYMGTKVTTTRK